MSDVLSIANQLKETFGDSITEVSEFRGEVTVVVNHTAIADVVRHCKETDGFEFNYLSDIGGIDYPNEDLRFHVNYVLYSLKHNHTIRLKVKVTEEDKVPSVTGYFKGASWFEREIYDMFGVTFDNHPDMRRILMPFDWTGHPLRKDYPLGYEEVQFSFNLDRVQAKKPHPKE